MPKQILAVARSGAMGVLPSEPLDLRAVNADIGQFPVAEIRKLPHGVSVTLPSLEEADDGCKH